MKRLHEVLLIVAVLLLHGPAALSQCMVTDSLIKIYPYFAKDDVMKYSRHDMTMTIVGKDTTVTRHIKEVFQVECKKASDKKGYVLEKTVLEVEDLNEYQDSNDGNQAITRAVSEALTQATVGMKVRFHIDPFGQNLAVEDPDKVIADLEKMMNAVWDELTAKYPLIGSMVPKEAVTGVYKNLMANPEMLLNEFKEMVQMFQMHGQVYDYEVLKTLPLESPSYTRPGEVKYIALDVPEEGQAKQDYDDYKLVLQGETYQDAAAATQAKLAETYGQQFTIEQLKQVLGDKMPSGEIVIQEFMTNEYFYDGWPKEFNYCTTSISSAGTEATVNYLVWEERDVKR